MKETILKPVEKYIRELDQKEKMAAFAVLKDVRENGLKSNFIKLLRNNVYEVKVDTKDHWHRILCVLIKNTDTGAYLLYTNAFKKKVNKVPKDEIELANQRAKVHIESLRK